MREKLARANVRSREVCKATQTALFALVQQDARTGRDLVVRSLRQCVGGEPGAHRWCGYAEALACGWGWRLTSSGCFAFISLPTSFSRSKSPMQYLFTFTTLEVELGGIARSVPALALALARSGQSVRVVGPRAPSMTIDLKAHSEWEALVSPDRGALKQTLDAWTRAPASDLCLYHAGIWDPLNHHIAALGCRRQIPVIASPRSMLDPWALEYRRWKKWLAWRFYARRDLQRAACVHVTAELEAGYVRQAGYRGPVIVVPNGIDFPTTWPERPARPANAPKRILFLSRLHPKKGLPDLIQAFAQVNDRNWELIIAGNDEAGYINTCRAQAATQPNGDRIRFVGAIDDTAKWPLYASADLFVLPSYSENFGLVIGEALAAGTPVITTTATPWDDLPQKRCGWQIPTGPEALTAALLEAMRLSDAERHAMGEHGAAWVRRTFGWDQVAQRFHTALEPILHPAKVL